MPVVALYTFGILREAREHPTSQGFMQRLEATFEAAERAPGFVDRSRRHPVTNDNSWQPWAQPRFVPEARKDAAPASLSTWADLESVYAYAYDGVHAQALAGRRSWFLPPQWPSYVIWWSGQRPDFLDATRCLEGLHDAGPTPVAFTFKKAFAADGTPYTLDAKRVAAYRARVTPEAAG